MIVRCVAAATNINPKGLERLCVRITRCRRATTTPRSDHLSRCDTVYYSTLALCSAFNFIFFLSLTIVCVPLTSFLHLAPPLPAEASTLESASRRRRFHGTKLLPRSIGTLYAALLHREHLPFLFCLSPPFFGIRCILGHTLTLNFNVRCPGDIQQNRLEAQYISYTPSPHTDRSRCEETDVSAICENKRRCPL
jgi:hypothetical protein